MNDDIFSGADRASSQSSTSHSTTEEAQAAYHREVAEWARRLKLSVDDLEVFLRNGYAFDKIPAKDSAWRRDMLGVLKKALVKPSRWVLVSGLYAEIELEEKDRRERLKALYRAVLLYVRQALARQREDGASDERGVFWDPVAEVCRGLEIAPSKLSALCKEYSGNSLSQVIDCVRAERVKKMMRVRIREFVKRFRARCASLTPEGSSKDAKTQRREEQQEEMWVVWGELKESRKWPVFCQNTWAMGFGFATYRRMYRACVAVWRETPHQMEMGFIKLALDERGEEGEEKVEVEMTAKEVEMEIRGLYLYTEDNMLGLRR